MEVLSGHALLISFFLVFFCELDIYCSGGNKSLVQTRNIMDEQINVYSLKVK